MDELFGCATDAIDADATLKTTTSPYMRPELGLQIVIFLAIAPRIPPTGIGLQYPSLDVRKQKSPVDRGLQGFY